MIALFVAALAFAASEPAAQPVPASTNAVAESDASRAARDWLALVDARNWQGAAEGVHAKLGPAEARELLSDNDIPAPPNGARAIRFHTTFANNQSKTETLSLTREDGQWRVAGIYVE